MEVSLTVMMSVLSAFTSQNIGSGKNERTVLTVKYGICDDVWIWNYMLYTKPVYR